MSDDPGHRCIHCGEVHLHCCGQCAKARPLDGTDAVPSVIEIGTGRVVPVEAGPATDPRIHDLKCWPEFFEATRAGRKSFEFRVDDRDVQVGDRLRLREWSPCVTGGGDYTGRELTVEVTYRLPLVEDRLFELGDPRDAPGRVILSIARCPAPGPSAPTARDREAALVEVERLAARLIGRFPVACGGRHFEGRTCDYCLVEDILRVSRAALATRAIAATGATTGDEA